MSLKENIDAIKNEISTEEKFLEGIIKSERFFKKYKLPIIVAIAILIISGAGYGIMQMQIQKRLEVSNEAYATLLENPNDSVALQKLKDNNERLFYFYQFQMALKNSDTEKLQEISQYTLDPLISDLASYQLNDNSDQSVLLTSFQALNEAYQLLKEGNIEEANAAFAKIDIDSPLRNIVKNLQHYKGSKQ